ncbi:acyl carrier protein [Kitasatospora kifunensis]|uniref:Acyl carrier protein n=1 Tax=Kitasatospora kifunensis TaxID=58351 RepID=A0A7W7R3T8_KITKI|nr:phosphopantetheine-binding protein [Kitasatospora kifunensis]MBB4924861.1 acyl carrier protein [Kitasatospora kifunensis]
MTTGAADRTVTRRLQAALLAVSEVTPELLFGEPDGGFADELDGELQLVDDLGFDSVMLMEFKSGLEEHFPELGEFSLPEILPHLHTVGSLVDYLALQLSPVEVA